jgi:hypothetical protein
MMDPTKRAKHREALALKDKDRKAFASDMEIDGKWQPIARIAYERVRRVIRAWRHPAFATVEGRSRLADRRPTGASQALECVESKIPGSGTRCGR